MSKFDDCFEFRLARYDEIDSIMAFIRKYWTKKNHILGTNRAFFEYEFCVDNKVGFFIALDKQTGEIAAGEGIYFYSKEYVPQESDISGGMFLANPDCKVPLIGIELMKRKLEVLRPRALVGPGVNIRTSGQLYIRMLKQDVSRMRHFYILNEQESYSIACIKNLKCGSVKKEIQYELTLCDSAEELFAKFEPDNYKYRKPFKDAWYITKRYFNHPIYKYQIYVANDDIAIVCREVAIKDAKILRLIDVLGNQNIISNLGKAFQKLLKDGNYEYIDFYELGVEENVILDAGFVERMENDENIIPNYFEPYVCCNVEIYAQRLDTESLCFKGDGDQDRPNEIK